MAVHSPETNSPGSTPEEGLSFRSLLGVVKKRLPDMNAGDKVLIQRQGETARQANERLAATATRIENLRDVLFSLVPNDNEAQGPIVSIVEPSRTLPYRVVNVYGPVLVKNEDQQEIKTKPGIAFYFDGNTLDVRETCFFLEHGGQIKPSRVERLPGLSVDHPAPESVLNMLEAMDQRAAA